jgi:hypothetical protein
MPVPHSEALGELDPATRVECEGQDLTASLRIIDVR